MSNPDPSLADTNHLRKVVTLHFVSHEYLLELYQRAAQAGLIHPSEMVVAGYTWNEIFAAQTAQLSAPSVEPPAEPLKGHEGGSPTEPAPCPPPSIPALESPDPSKEGTEGLATQP